MIGRDERAATMNRRAADKGPVVLEAKELATEFGHRDVSFSSIMAKFLASMDSLEPAVPNSPARSSWPTKLRADDF